MESVGASFRLSPDLLRRAWRAWAASRPPALLLRVLITLAVGVGGAGVGLGVLLREGSLIPPSLLVASVAAGALFCWILALALLPYLAVRSPAGVSEVQFVVSEEGLHWTVGARPDRIG